MRERESERERSPLLRARVLRVCAVRAFVWKCARVCDCVCVCFSACARVRVRACEGVRARVRARVCECARVC